MKLRRWGLLACAWAGIASGGGAGCAGGDDGPSIDAPGSPGDGGRDAPVVDAAIDAPPRDASLVDARLIDAPVDAQLDAAIDALDGPSDPNDPVLEVPAFGGAYGLARITTSDTSPVGMYYRGAAGETQLSTVRSSFVRYRDRVVAQSKVAAELRLFDQATATLSSPVALPSDVIGAVTVRGDFVYAGGLGRVYSYEIATGMWRSRALTGAGSCHHAAASANRLYVLCSNPVGTGAMIFVTWANRTMSDPELVGSFSPAHSAATAWITASPTSDTAYYSSMTPTTACIGRATPAGLTSCALSLSAGSYAGRSQLSEDGNYLYVKRGTAMPYNLVEIYVPTGQAVSVGAVDAFATCPDNAVVWQQFVMSKRRAGGVTTDVTLMSGAELDMACPLRRL
jgi:hypothetical protein